MTYACIGENWGLSLIRDAAKAGYYFDIRSEGESLYEGYSVQKAWDAVTSVDESLVYIVKPGGKTETAYIVLEYGQEGDEVISDYTVDGWIDTWWKAKRAAS